MHDDDHDVHDDAVHDEGCAARAERAALHGIRCMEVVYASRCMEVVYVRLTCHRFPMYRTINRYSLLTLSASSR